SRLPAATFWSRPSSLRPRRFWPLRKEDEAHACEHQRNGEQHSHRESAEEESELRIRFAEEFTEEAGEPISQCKDAGHDARASERAGTYCNRKHGQKHEAFQDGLVELARMTRERAAVGEHHGPGHVADAAPQFAVHKVGETSEEEADRRDRAGHVGEREKGNAAPL